MSAITSALKRMGLGVKDFGRSLSAGSIGAKVGKAVAYLGVGAGTNLALGYMADQERAYIGNQAFDSYYGSGPDNISTAIKFASYGNAALALIGRDSLSTAFNRLRYTGAKINLASAKRGISMASRPRYRAAKASVERLSKYPRMSVANAAALGSVALMPSLVGYEAMAAGGVIGLAGGYTALKMAAKHPIGALAGAAAFGAGAYSSMAIPRYGTAEGAITDFSEGSAVSRMNFSTAGLVQALHNSRRG